MEEKANNTNSFLLQKRKLYCAALCGNWRIFVAMEGAICCGLVLAFDWTASQFISLVGVADRSSSLYLKVDEGSHARISAALNL